MAIDTSRVADIISDRIQQRMDQVDDSQPVEVDVFIDGSQIKQIGERYHLRTAHVEALIEELQDRGFDAFPEGGGIRVCDERERENIVHINSIDIS